MLAHVDGTVRAQIVSKHPSLRFLRKLMTALKSAGELPVLINTSLNGPGEPICNSEVDGYRSFGHLNLDGLVVGSKFLTRMPR